MKERYGHELIKWMKWIGIWRINRDSIDFKWGYFAPRFGLEAKLHRGGYFDTRYAITLCPIWGCWHICLPFKTSLPEGCDMPEYGISIHNETFWLHTLRSRFDEVLCSLCLHVRIFLWGLGWELKIAYSPL